MNAMPDREAALRDAFQAAAVQASSACSPEDLERVWQAVAGEGAWRSSGNRMSADERRDLIDRMATDPAIAQAWRIAHELERARTAETAAPVARKIPAVFFGLAATLCLIVGGSLLFLTRTPTDTFRAPTTSVVEPLIATDAALARDAFVLRWKPGPEGARYAVRATSEDLAVLATASELATAEFTISREALASLPSGARVFWQVVMTVPSGETVSSHTFVARVQ